MASFVSMSFAIPLIMRDNSNSSVAYFTTLAGHSSSPINQKTVNANGYSFWIGKPTSSSCPDAVASGRCPEGNKTVIEVNAMDGTCVMVGNRIPPSILTFNTDGLFCRMSKFLEVKPSMLQGMDPSNTRCPIQEVRYLRMARRMALS